MAQEHSRSEGLSLVFEYKIQNFKKGISSNIEGTSWRKLEVWNEDTLLSTNITIEQDAVFKHLKLATNRTFNIENIMHLLLESVFLKVKVIVSQQHLVMWTLWIVISLKRSIIFFFFWYTNKWKHFNYSFMLVCAVAWSPPKKKTPPENMYHVGPALRVRPRNLSGVGLIQ